MNCRQITLGILALTLVLVGGCVRSLSPVVKDDQVTTDNNILGRWNSTENDKEYFEISAGDDKTYHAVYHDKEGKTGNFDVRLGKVGELTIAEVSPGEPDLPNTSGVYWLHLQPVYSFFWLTQTTPNLQGQTFKVNWFRQYVSAHPDELKVAPGQGANDPPLITATTEDLQAFILRHYKDEGAASEVLTFVRPGATTRPAP